MENIMSKRTLEFHWVLVFWLAFAQIFFGNTVSAASHVEFLEKSDERILTYSSDLGLTANVDFLQIDIVEIVIQFDDKTILVNVGYGDREREVYIKGVNVNTGEIERFTINDSDVLKRFLLYLMEEEGFGHNILERTLLRSLNLLYSWPQNAPLFLSADKSTISSMMGGHSGEVSLRSEIISGSDNSTINSTVTATALSQSLCTNINEAHVGAYIFSSIDPVLCAIGRESIPISHVVGPYPFQPNGCFGRCGSGCIGDPGGAGGLAQNDLNIFTQSCFNHDACVDALGDADPCCMEMFLLTIDDFYNGTDCTPVLTVTIYPQAAVDAGAKWQVEGDPYNTGWHSSAEKIDWLPENTYRIIFSDIAGWNTPSPQTTSIKSGTPVITLGTYSVTNATVAPEQLQVFARGGDNAPYQMVWDGSTWQWWYGYPGAISEAPAVVSYKGQLHVFVRGSDYALYQMFWDGAKWNGWYDLGGYLSSAPAVVNYNGQLHLFAVGADHALHQMFWDGVQWNGWYLLGGDIIGSPAVVNYNGQIHVFVTGTDHALYQMFWDGIAWNGWYRYSFYLAYGPGAVSLNGNLHIFAVSSDHALYQMFWDGSKWNGWYQLGGSVIGSPAPVGYNGQVVVLVTGGDNAIWWDTFDGTKWSGWGYLGGYTLSSPGVANYQPGG